MPFTKSIEQKCKGSNDGRGNLQKVWRNLVLSNRLINVKRKNCIVNFYHTKNVKKYR